MSFTMIWITTPAAILVSLVIFLLVHWKFRKDMGRRLGALEDWNFRLDGDAEVSKKRREDERKAIDETFDGLRRRIQTLAGEALARETDDRLYNLEAAVSKQQSAISQHSEKLDWLGTKDVDTRIAVGKHENQITKLLVQSEDLEKRLIALVAYQNACFEWVRGAEEKVIPAEDGRFIVRPLRGNGTPAKAK